MQYRLAVPNDAEAIGGLITTTWEMASDTAWIAEVLALPQQTTWVAEDPSRIVGFCAGFTTQAADGTLRWEVDLLAVHPDARGQGAGKTLVRHSRETGRERGATFQRGLIAAGNTASEKCFAANGFAAEATCDLWVGAPAAAAHEQPVPEGTHLIAVDTLTYRGIWIEGRRGADSLSAGQQRAVREGRNTVGTVVPKGEANDCERLLFAHIDTYQWWNLRL